MAERILGPSKAKKAKGLDEESAGHPNCRQQLPPETKPLMEAKQCGASHVGEATEFVSYAGIPRQLEADLY